jgi:hypothetical protein
MSKSIVGAAVLAISLWQPAQAAPSNPDLAALQQQINALRTDYEARISQLEARLRAAETAAATPAAEPVPDVPFQPIEEIVIADTPLVSTAASANASNPGVSVVLNGNYVATSRDPAGARIPGFLLSDEAGLPGRGLSLGESEVTLAANVDPFLLANLTASFSGDNQVSVEEAFIQTTALPGGLTLKGGRFFSAVGYLNERHAHNWSFIDMPLPYRALLGNQYGDDGVQVRWLAPTPTFLELGAEAFRGDSFPAANGNKNRPGVQTVFARAGADINDNSSWLAAMSYVRSQARDRDTGGDVFNGKDSLAIASFVYKWAPGGNLADRNLTLSGEHFWDQTRGDLNGVPVRRDAQGWYAQGVYQFTKGWSFGLRYATLEPGRSPVGLAGSALDGLGRKPSTISGLVEYDSSEFGRFRLQYSHDKAEARANDLLQLQYTVIYGPHAAHRY